MKKICIQCQDVEQRLLRHEQTITQLLEIIAATNTRVAELAMKHSEHEKNLLTHLHHPRFLVASKASRVSPNIPHFKE